MSLQEAGMTAPDYIFSPHLYDDVRLPVLEAGLLPPWCYTSHEFHEREVREVFMKVWNLVGRVEQIPGPGDYIALELAGVPVIILRDEDHEVRAFANTCRHRGCRLLTGEGSCDRYIRCPYHGWAYAFDGRLVGAPGMKETLDFDPSQIALHRIRLETWEGFMFICFDAQSESLMDYLGDFPERFAMYCFGEMVLTPAQGERHRVQLEAPDRKCDGGIPHRYGSRRIARPAGAHSGGDARANG